MHSKIEFRSIRLTIVLALAVVGLAVPQFGNAQAAHFGGVEYFSELDIEYGRHCDRWQWSDLHAGVRVGVDFAALGARVYGQHDSCSLCGERDCGGCGWEFVYHGG